MSYDSWAAEDWVGSGALRSGNPTMKVRQDSEQKLKPDMSEAIIDTQSVKTAAMLNQSVGRKCHNLSSDGEI